MLGTIRTWTLGGLMAIVALLLTISGLLLLVAVCRENRLVSSADAPLMDRLLFSLSIAIIRLQAYKKSAKG